MRRLLEGDGSEVERGLLDALRLERPSEELEARMRAAIGLAPIAAPEPAPPASATAPAGKALGTWGAIGIGSVVVALLVGGGTMLGSGEPSADAPAPNPPPVVAPATEPAPTPAVAAEPRAPEPAAEQANAEPRPQRTHISPPPTSNAASLREEIRLIDSARIAVKKNEGARAVSILDQYVRRFPNGTFREEARVLRTEALKKR
jgi:hypothetical protein